MLPPVENIAAQGQPVNHKAYGHIFSKLARSIQHDLIPAMETSD